MRKKVLLIVSFAILIFGGLTSRAFAQNLTPGGSFESGEMWNSWANNGGVASFSVVTGAVDAPEGSNYMKIDVDTLGGNSYNIQTQTPTFQVVKDSAYKVSWWAKSDTAGKEMNLYFADPDGQQYGGRKALTTDWAEYSKTWTAALTGDCVIKINWEMVAEYSLDSFVVLDPAYDPGLIPQTIDFPEIGRKNTTDAPFTISATASSDLPVTLSLVEGSTTATLVGDLVTLTGEVGKVTIKASQAGNDTYNPAPDVERTFDVLPEGWVLERTRELDVKLALNPITIDGMANEAEWGGSAMKVNPVTYYNDPNNDPDYYNDKPSPDDLSAWFKMLWSPTGIYVYADITDDTIHSDSADIRDNGGAHQYDNLEVYFHVPEADWAEDLKASDDYVMTTFQLRSNIDMSGDYWSGRSPYATGGGGGWTSSKLDNLYTYAFAPKQGGVTFEGFYPFDLLFGGSTASLPNMFEPRSILFEFAYGDSDGEGVGGVRSGGIVWNTIPDIFNSYTDLAAQHRKQFGQINLTGAIATGIDDFNMNNESVKVYPTLFENHIMIQSENKVVDVRLYNTLGVEMLHIQNPNGIEYIDQLDALNTGLYFLKMKSGNKIITAKIIKD